MSYSELVACVSTNKLHLSLSGIVGLSIIGNVMLPFIPSIVELRDDFIGSEAMEV